MTMLDEPDVDGLFAGLSDPMQCPDCVAEGDLCARHAEMGLEMELELFELLAEGDPARFDDIAALEKAAEVWP
jgi:hypothetical protein